MLGRFFLIASVVILSGCSTTYKNKNVEKQQFPSVEGTTLEKKKVQLPNFFSGEKAILLIGFKQNAQFDIDRWLIGLNANGIRAGVFEIPTVVGMIPGMISGRIDEGMRSGIPEELWANVITVYQSGAKKLAEFTGNQDPLNARVLVLDRQGVIVFFHDRGFSVPHLDQLVSVWKGKTGKK